MSVHLNLCGPYDGALEVEAKDATLWIRTRDKYGFAQSRVSMRLTSADRDVMRAALDKLDTAEADADAREMAA